MKRKSVIQTRRHTMIKRNHKKVMERQRKLYIQVANVSTTPS